MRATRPLYFRNNYLYLTIRLGKLVSSLLGSKQLWVLHEHRFYTRVTTNITPIINLHHIQKFTYPTFLPLSLRDSTLPA